MRLLGNFIWFIFGGCLMGLSWWLTGLVMCLLIVTIPWAKSCFVIGQFCFLPFGRETISRKELYNQDDLGTGKLGLIGNIIWLILGGFGLMIGHLFSAVLCIITIIGIPFGIQHLKLAGISLFPIGQTIVTKEVAAAARRRNAEENVGVMRKNSF